MSQVTVAQQKQIFQAAESVWQGIAADIPEVSVSTEEMLELSLDANRLETFGYPAEQALYTQLVMDTSYGDALKALAKHSPFSGWEAGGSMAL